MRKLLVSTGGTHRSHSVQNQKMNWTSIVERCRQPVRTPETFAQFKSMSKAEQGEVKSVGYLVGGQFKNGIRKIGNLMGRDVLTLDIDHAPSDFEFEVELAYGGYAHLVHSTHSHVTKHPRLRILFPLTRTITPDEYEPVARKLAEMADMDWFDDTTFQASRIMYWPSASSDGDWFFEEGKGDFIDPDELLQSYGSNGAWKDCAAWPTSERQVGELRRAHKRAEDPLTKTNLVGSFCRVFTIDAAIAEFIPEAYVPVEDTRGESSRYTYTGSTTSGGAVVYENKWLYSHHESDPVSGKNVNAFDLVRLHRFGHLDEKIKKDTPIGRLPSYKAMQDLALGTGAVCEEIIAEMSEGFEDAPSENTKSSLAEDGASKDNSWKRKIEFNNKKEIVKSQRNLILLIENDPATEGKLGLNGFTRLPAFLEDLPWRKCKDKVNGDNWNDDDELMLLHYFAQRYRTEWTVSAVFQAVRTVMVQNQFHPIKDYLEGLEWDGTPRLDTMLHDHLGVKRSAYSDAVSRKTLCAAVARIFNPGCKADYMLVIEGEQGKRKSAFVEALASRPWYTDGVSSLDTNKAIESMQGSWFLEMDELVAFSKTQVEHEKAFLSRQVDKARMAYGRHVIQFPRQCVFVGTTNDAEYLKDATGNRRIWPVRATVNRIDIDAVLAARDQLWAEAVVVYQAGELLYLENLEIEKQARIEQRDRQLDDNMDADIANYLAREARTNRYVDPDDAVSDLEEASFEARDRVSYREIWQFALGEKGRPRIGDCKRIREAISHLDDWAFSPSVRFGKNAPARGFIHTKRYRKAR